jgi:hypothetical protein
LQELEICKEDVRLPLVKSSSQLKTKIVKFVKSM